MWDVHAGIDGSVEAPKLANRQQPGLDGFLPGERPSHFVFHGRSLAMATDSHRPTVPICPQDRRFAYDAAQSTHKSAVANVT
jgi:hypothetical protein